MVKCPICKRSILDDPPENFLIRQVIEQLELIRSTCNGCKKYVQSKYQVLGHKHCSSHRDCTGKTKWLPERCKACAEFKETFTTLSGGEQHLGIRNLKDMLRKVARNRSKYGPWEYIAPLKSTFPEYFADNILSSTPINSPRQGDLDEPHTMPPPSTTAIPLGPPPPRSTTALQQQQPLNQKHQVAGPPMTGPPMTSVYSLGQRDLGKPQAPLYITAGQSRS